MRFRRYAVERIAAAVAGLFLAVVAVFLACHVLGFELSPTAGAAVRAAHARYADESFGDFLWRLIGHASLGRSFFGNVDIASTSFKAATVTLSLVAWALFIGLLLAVPLALL